MNLNLKKKIFHRFLDNSRIFYGNFILIYVDFMPLDPDPDKHKKCGTGSESKTLLITEKSSKFL